MYSTILDKNYNIHKLLNLFSSFGVAEPDDLFASFDDTLEDHEFKLNNGLTVNQFMSNWTLQSGYPVLYVTKNKTSNTFILTQVNMKIHFVSDREFCV